MSQIPSVKANSKDVSGAQQDLIIDPPAFKTVHQMIDLKSEIEANLRKMEPDLNHRFLYRVIAFSLSGTCLVDMPCDTDDKECSRDAKLACKLKAKVLT